MSPITGVFSFSHLLNSLLAGFPNRSTLLGGPYDGLAGLSVLHDVALRPGRRPRGGWSYDAATPAQFAAPITLPPLPGLPLLGAASLCPPLVSIIPNHTTSDVPVTWRAIKDDVTADATGNTDTADVLSCNLIGGYKIGKFKPIDVSASSFPVETRADSIANWATGTICHYLYLHYMGLDIKTLMPLLAHKYLYPKLTYVYICFISRTLSW